MFLKLSLLLSTIGIIACNVPFDTTKEVKYEEINQIHQRNYQHSDYLNSYTEVVYKYDTNEVNSVDDLIVGNIYHINITDIENLANGSFISCSFVHGYRGDQRIDLDVNTYDGYYINCSKYNSELCYIAIYSDALSYVSTYYLPYEFDFVYRTTNQNVVSPVLQYITSSSFNVIESVIYHQPQTVIGVINEFCETYLFSEIPYVNTMSFEIGGQSINLMTWLVMAVGLVIGIGILILLFFFFKWIVLLFAGIFKK